MENMSQAWKHVLYPKVVLVMEVCGGWLAVGASAYADITDITDIMKSNETKVKCMTTLLY